MQTGIVWSGDHGNGFVLFFLRSVPALIKLSVLPTSMCSTCRFILSGKERRGGVGERREGVGGEGDGGVC